MGGDRDGNPFVTADVTEATLLRLRAAAVEQHLAWCDRLHDLLTVSAHVADGAVPLVASLSAICDRWPAVAAAVEPIPAHETYRRWIRMIGARMISAWMRRVP